MPATRLVIDGVTFKLSLLPSGIVRPGKLSLIGNGVVVDPWALAEEIAKLESQGRAHQPGQSADRGKCTAHPAACTANSTRCARPRPETARIGTTGRGIGPAYEDKVGRRAIRMQDLSNFDTIGPKIDRLLQHHNALRRGHGEAEVKAQDLIEQLARSRRKFRTYIDAVWTILDDARAQGKRVLFEGAQGILLDIDHGTYPFVTSSNTVAAQAATGSGHGH